MRKSVFAALLALTVLTASPVAGCEECVFGLDQHYYCKDPHIYDLPGGPIYAPCEVDVICYRTQGGSICFEYCSGNPCFVV